MSDEHYEIKGLRIQELRYVPESASVFIGERSRFFDGSDSKAATNEGRIEEDAQDLWWKNSKAFQHFRPSISNA